MSATIWAWQDHAACRGLGLELFFGPPDGERYDQDAKERREARARAVCASCEVRDDCLTYALAEPEKAGIWGGMDEDERARERRNATRRVRETAARRAEAMA